MAVILYYHVTSPPSRAVLTVLTLLKIPHEITNIDTGNEDQMKPEFLEMNPQHTIPILKDDETIVIDSHVINAYLVEKYAKGKDKELYPEDPAKRAVVTRQLHFDNGVLFLAYRRVKRAYVPFKDITGVTPEIIKEYEDIYNMVERFLKNSKFLAGNDPTIADISAYTSLTSMAIIWPPKESKFTLTTAYLKRCETDIEHLKSINDPGIDAVKKLMEGFKTTL